MFRNLWNRINPVTIAREVANTFTQRVIPQGAAEISQALNHQNAAYVPYGHGQRPAPIDTMGSFQDTVNRHAQRPAQAQTNRLAQ